jgi:hypothetical protein
MILRNRKIFTQIIHAGRDSNLLTDESHQVLSLIRLWSNDGEIS